jgi:hypothetical protein
MAEKELTERAIEDPAREFTTPEAVVTHPALPKSTATCLDGETARRYRRGSAREIDHV